MRPALTDFERVYRQSYGRFVRVASAITRKPDTAAEAVQEAFARTIQRRRQFRGDASLEVWIWRAVVTSGKAYHFFLTVPAARFDPISKAVLALFPDPNNPGDLARNFIFNAVPSARTRSWRRRSICVSPPAKTSTTSTPSWICC